MEIIFVFQLIVLIFSVVVHELSHGYVADYLGDNTARLAGRLTLNPLKHLDPFGSVILPLLLSLIPGGIVFGWAKPVPYNPFNLRRPERDGALIAAAGPLSNIAVAVVFGLLYRLLSSLSLPASSFLIFGNFLSVVVLINVMLAIFNLVPIPPLDGSKVLYAFLPAEAQGIKIFLERYGIFIVLLFIFFGLGFIAPIIFAAYRFLMGI